MDTNPYNEYDFMFVGDVGDDPPFVAPDIKANPFARYMIRRRKSVFHVNHCTPRAAFQGCIAQANRTATPTPCLPFTNITQPAATGGR
jgi:hypothetical protein